MRMTHKRSEVTLVDVHECTGTVKLELSDEYQVLECSSETIDAAAGADIHLPYCWSGEA